MKKKFIDFICTIFSPCKRDCKITGNPKVNIVNDNLFWITEWYHSQCDGDWEHGKGIHIGTLDNPGWNVEIELEGTELEDKNFVTIDVEKSEHGWIYCSVNNNVFKGYGGPFNLPELLKHFCDWAKE